MIFQGRTTELERLLEIEMNKHLLDSITIWFMNTSMKLRVEEYY